MIMPLDPQQPSGEPSWPAPDVSHLITEDGSSQGRRAHELALRRVEVGSELHPAIVPDVFVALDVEPRPASGPDQVNSYFVWEFGKVPDIVIEIVSNREGGELDTKLRSYERMRVPNYVVYDRSRCSAAIDS